MLVIKYTGYCIFGEYTANKWSSCYKCQCPPNVFFVLAAKDKSPMKLSFDSTQHPRRKHGLSIRLLFSSLRFQLKIVPRSEHCRTRQCGVCLTHQSESRRGGTYSENANQCLISSDCFGLPFWSTVNRGMTFTAKVCGFFWQSSTNNDLREALKRTVWCQFGSAVTLKWAIYYEPHHPDFRAIHYMLFLTWLTLF